jgi:hypothetical protein
MPSNDFWFTVTHGNGKFVAISIGSAAAYSTDGINWTETTMPAGRSWVSTAHNGGPEMAQTTIWLLSDAQTIIPNRSIEPNQVDEIVGGITLSAGDQIRVYSESDDLVVQVYGVEIA